MRRVNNKKVKKSNKKHGGGIFIVLLFLAICIYGGKICVQIFSLKNCVNDAANNIQELQNNTVVYKTSLKSVYVPKTVSKLLNENSLKLSIDMENAVVDVAKNYSGLIYDTKISKCKVKIDDEKLISAKVFNKSETGISNFKLKVDKVRKILSFSDAIDIYLKQDNNFALYKTMEATDIIEITGRELYLIYVAPQNIVADEPLNIYNKVSNKLQITVEPQNATYSKFKYSNYDEDAIQITESGDILPSKIGKTNITCMVGNVQKDITLNVLPTVEKITVNKPSTSIKLGNWSYVIASIYPQDAANTELVWTSSDENIAKVENGMIKSIAMGSCKVTVATKTEPKVECNINVTVTEKSTGYYTQGTGGYPETIIEGPYYVDGILIVNKKYSIPTDFANGLDDNALNALYELQDAADESGYSLPIVSGFRSYNFQKDLYERYVYEDGQADADTSSARPGHSEHSTGLAFDVGSVTSSYGVTPAGKWLAKNCHKYGFIVRYPQGKSDITGYIYEPWHIRYLGVENATKVYESGLTLEEYLGVD
jgi:hypothetical protein